MLKVVVDTNIIFSASFRGNPGKVIDLWKEGELVICVSQEILSEYIRVLKKAGFAADDLKEVLSLFAEPAKTFLVRPTKHFEIVEEDPGDNKFLNCAVKAEADYIISGDKHLKKLKEFKGVKILSPTSFLKELPRTSPKCRP